MFKFFAIFMMGVVSGYLLAVLGVYLEQWDDEDDDEDNASE